MLDYLGLPNGPTDLCVVLLSEEEEHDNICEGDTDGKVNPTSTTEDQLSSSLWLARLITSWCLVGRKAVSRDLFARLRTRFSALTEGAPQSSLTPAASYERSLDLLLPEPSVRIPHLIHLPRQYVSLLALATELK